MVELQLSFSTEIKRLLDRAYGVVHNKHKKAETTESRPPADDPFSQENLQLVALGQDIQRKRYWVTDGEYLQSFPLSSRHVFARICTPEGVET